MVAGRHTCGLVATCALALAGCGDGERASTGSSSTASASAPAGTTTTTASPARGTDESAQSTAGDAREPEPGGASSVGQALSAVLTAKGTAAQACGRFVTAGFVGRSYGGRANCVAAQRPAALADAIEVRSRSGAGRRRKLVVVPSGGPYDGAKVEVVVVASGAGFAIDRLDAHVPAGP